MRVEWTVTRQVRSAPTTLVLKEADVKQTRALPP